MKPKICIVVSKFNGDITSQIKNNAVYKLKNEGIENKYLKVILNKGDKVEIVHFIGGG